MRKVFVLLALMTLVAVTASGQELQKIEIYGGYSFMHIDSQGVNGSGLDALIGAPAGTFNVKKNYSGWNAAAQWNVNKWLGITADFSGHYGTPISVNAALPAGTTLPSANLHNFLFGPTFSYRTARMTPFVHTLFGVNRVKLDSFLAAGTRVPEFADNAFAMAIGGGLDYRITDRFKLRVGQFDYLFTKHDFSGGSPGVATHQNNLRFSTGVVIGF